jgi:Fic family protein
MTRSIKLLNTSKPTAAKAIRVLEKLKILREISGRRRDRVFAYDEYLRLLGKDTE